MKEHNENNKNIKSSEQKNISQIERITDDESLLKFCQGTRKSNKEIK